MSKMRDLGSTTRLIGYTSVPSLNYYAEGDAIVHDVDIGLVMVSIPHRRVNGKWNGGGPFALYKRKITGMHSRVRMGNNGVFVGGDVTTGYLPGPHVSGGYTPPLLESVVNQINMNADFTTGYKKARPGNPVASAGQFLYELYTDLPTIPLRLLWKLRKFQTLGHEYLNIQFGWLPFVSDLKKMYNLTQTIHKRLDELVRNNGKVIHREATVRSSRDVTSSVVHSEYPFSGLSLFSYMPPLWGSGRTTIITTTETTERVWFSADFRYYTPDIGSSRWTARAVATLFGVNPTPDLLYQVLPWSWLLDWFTNVGDVISNASNNAVDNLVADHAFIMRHASVKTTTSISTSWENHGNEDGMKNGSLSLESFDFTETKCRGMGNPFLPSLSLTDFTSRQAGIAAALGISRS
jgi:hypothetical protein